MSATPYQIDKKDDLVFTFTSVGPKGEIPKLILYEPLTPNVYNLAFGDQREGTLDIDDTARSDNDDLKEILATVIETIPFFFEKHPDKYLYFTGSTPVRTYLYLRTIRNHFKEFSKQYEFLGGLEDGSHEAFVLNKNYQFIVLSKK